MRRSASVLSFQATTTKGNYCDALREIRQANKGPPLAVSMYTMYIRHFGPWGDVIDVAAGVRRIRV